MSPTTQVGIAPSVMLAMLGTVTKFLAKGGNRNSRERPVTATSPPAARRSPPSQAVTLWRLLPHKARYCAVGPDARTPSGVLSRPLPVQDHRLSRHFPFAISRNIREMMLIIRTQPGRPRLSVGPEMKRVLSAGYRRARESGGPEPVPLLSPGAGSGLNRGRPLRFWSPWIPAFAGMTNNPLSFLESFQVRLLIWIKFLFFARTLSIIYCI
jgi:hypothetical protein